MNSEPNDKGRGNNVADKKTTGKDLTPTSTSKQEGILTTAKGTSVNKKTTTTTTVDSEGGISQKDEETFYVVPAGGDPLPRDNLTDQHAAIDAAEDFDRALGPRPLVSPNDVALEPKKPRP